MDGKEDFGRIVSVWWLALNINNPRVVVLDASMRTGSVQMPAAEADSLIQIPGTRIFDFDTRICDRSSPLPHMMPSPDLFEKEVRALGINRESIVVVYDRTGVYASPRAWWMFKAMGHDLVAVLDGGFPAWTEARLPVERVSQAICAGGDFVAAPRPGLICDLNEVASALNDIHYAVVDARSEGRFLGREPEPRAGLRSGHMPNAVNLPYTMVLSDGRMLPPDRLRMILASKVTPDQKLIFTCGSGVTACILALAAEMVGHQRIAVYDGSWSEWGLPSERPVVRM